MRITQPHRDSEMLPHLEGCFEEDKVWKRFSMTSMAITLVFAWGAEFKFLSRVKIDFDPPTALSL